MTFDIAISGYNSFQVQLVLSVPGKDIEEACQLVAAKYNMNWLAKEAKVWDPTKRVFFVINPHVNAQPLRSIINQIDQGNADLIDGLIMMHENDNISVEDWVTGNLVIKHSG